MLKPNPDPLGLFRKPLQTIHILPCIRILLCFPVLSERSSSIRYTMVSSNWSAKVAAFLISFSSRLLRQISIGWGTHFWWSTVGPSRGQTPTPEKIHCISFLGTRTAGGTLPVQTHMKLAHFSLPHHNLYFAWHLKYMLPKLSLPDSPK